jgi:pilus assembly protein CpaE
MADPEIRILVAHDDGVTDGWVGDHIPGDSGIVVAEVLGSLSSSSDVMQSSDADVLVVACSEEPDEALGLVEWWVGHRPGRPVVVLCQASASANGFVQRAFAVGADDLVMFEQAPAISPASSQQLIFSIHKAVVRKISSDEAMELATMVCVLGPKGGIGKTMTSCNLAVSLASSQKRVVLVDLDFQFGDVALSLGIRPERTAYDLAASGGSLDADKIDAYLVTHSTGLRVLAAPVRPDQSGLITPEFVAEVIAVLRSKFEYVILDTPPTFTPIVIAAIDASTYVCMIGMLDALSLKNTRLGLETLDLMGYPRDRIRVVLNRANTNVGITGHDVVSIIGREPDVLIPSSRDITRSVNEGEPIVLSQKRSEAAKAFNALAGLLGPPASTAPAARRRSLSLFGRRAG